MPTLQEASIHAQKPAGGVQAWSVGETYPATVVGLWDGKGATRWRAENLHTGEQAPIRETYREAQVDEYRLAMLHRTRGHLAV